MTTENAKTQATTTTNNYRFFKKSRSILTSVLIIIVFLIYSFIISQSVTLYKHRAWENSLQKTLKPPPTPVLQSPEPTTITPVQLYRYPFGKEITSLFQQVTQDYSGELLGINDAYVWWISNDDLNIINEYEPGIEYINFSCSDETIPYSKSTLEELNTRQEFNTISTSLAFGIKPIMGKNGFTQNQKNSSKSTEDKQFYDYIQAYENDNTKCVFRADPDCAAGSKTERTHYSFSFSCTELFNQNYQIQSPFLRDLNLGDAIVSITKQVGDFVNLNIHYRRTGQYMIAKLVNGKWTKLFSGQQAPDCKTMEENQVPQEVYGNCVNYTESN